MSDIVNIIDVTKLERPILAIIRLKPENLEQRTMAAVLTPYYQVTIDPARLSPSQEFIEFGQAIGDQLVGWRPVEDVIVEEVLGEYAEGFEPPKHVTYQAGQQVKLRPFRQVPELVAVSGR